MLLNTGWINKNGKTLTVAVQNVKGGNEDIPLRGKFHCRSACGLKC